MMLLNILVVSNLKRANAESYLYSVSFEISMYISKEGAIDENVNNYVKSINKDLYIVYTNDQYFAKGSLVEYQIGYSYTSVGNTKKEVLINKTSIIGAYS